MPTRKQRRRQQKSRRHEWEYVYVDDQGREVEVDPAEVEQTNGEKPKRGAAVERRNGRSAQARARVKQQRPRRTPQPPSWRRAAKRAAILGALFVVVFAFGLGGKNSNPLAAVLIGLIYATAFVPLQYFIDKVTYRSYLRRQDRTASKA
jgi:hypothetical protein